MNFPKRQTGADGIRGALENLTAESVTRRGGHLFLLGSVAFAALGFIEDGRPSESETTQIFACAEQLPDEPQNINEHNVPGACQPLKDDFSAPDFTYYDYKLPSSEAFLEDKIFTSHIDEERKKDFDQSLLLLIFALGAYGASSFYRRLDNPEPSVVVHDAEDFLRHHSRQQ